MWVAPWCTSYIKILNYKSALSDLNWIKPVITRERLYVCQSDVGQAGLHSQPFSLFLSAFLGLVQAVIHPVM